ncbi:MAG TPA: hypothetical protein DCS87_07190 [Rheinheimera sp.]|nr:hypothetical protein [Rheinheimera sp.]
MRCRLFKLSHSLLFAGLMLSHAANAEDWQWHGFISQGLMQSERSNFVNDTGKLSTELTEVGINTSYQLASDWRFAGQLMYLDGGNRYKDGWRVDYLFLNRTLVNDLDWQLDLYLGRFKNVHWLYSSTRDVPVTRPMIVLPQTVYFDAFRDIAVGSDGALLKSTNNTRFGEIEVNWSYGSTPVTKEMAQRVVATSVQGATEQDFVHQFSVYFRPQASQSQWGISLLDSDFNYKKAAVDYWFDGDFTVQRVMANWRYSAQWWELSSEIMQERVVVHGFYAPVFDRTVFAQGVFVLGSIELTPDTKLYLSHDYYVGNKDDRRGSLLPIQSGGMIKSYFGFQNDTGIGLSQNLAEKLQIKLEYHYSDGTGRLGPNVVPDLAVNQSRYHDLWAVQLLYWF